MSKFLLHTLSALACVMPALADAQSAHTYLSPDRAVSVRISAVSREGAESSVEVRRARGDLLLRRSYASPGCEHGIGVYRGAWTPDSQFFFFNAQMSGGHQPWHWAVYVYGRSENRIRNLDQYTGPIVTPDFYLKAPHSVEIRVLDVSNDKGDSTTVDLNLLGRRRRLEPNHSLSRSRS